jgi:hypothetical protein
MALGVMSSETSMPFSLATRRRFWLTNIGTPPFSACLSTARASRVRRLRAMGVLGGWPAASAPVGSKLAGSSLTGRRRGRIAASVAGLNKPLTERGPRLNAHTVKDLNRRPKRRLVRARLSEVPVRARPPGLKSSTAANYRSVDAACAGHTVILRIKQRVGSERGPPRRGRVSRDLSLKHAAECVLVFGIEACREFKSHTAHQVPREGGSVVAVDELG